MKKFLALLFFAASLAAAPALRAQVAPFSVQHASIDCGTVVSCTLAFPQPLSGGDFIVVGLRIGSLTNTVTVTDSLGHTFALAKRQPHTGNGNQGFIFYVAGVKAGTDSITIKQSSSSTLRFSIKEYGNVLASSPLDVAAGAEGTSNSPASAAMTTTGPGELIVGVGLTAGVQKWAAGGTFSLSDVAGGKVALEDQVQSAPGPIASSFKLGASDQWAALVAAFKPAPSGPPPDTMPPTVAVNAPSDGATISGIVALTASASDDTGIVSGVQFRVDGTDFGAALLTAPYILFLDTAMLGPGPHTIEATAKDAAGNGATSPAIRVTIAGQMFDLQLSYTDGSPFAPGGTLAISELQGTTWQTDVVAPISASGRVLFRWRAAVGTVYAIQTSDASGAVLWNLGTQLAPAMVPTAFSGASATILFLKPTNAWAGVSNLVVSY